jgi:hypothetical protein
MVVDTGVARERVWKRERCEASDSGIELKCVFFFHKMVREMMIIIGLQKRERNERIEMG